MGYKVNYGGNTGGDGPSPAIWADVPWLESLEDPNIGFGFWDDFLSFGDHISDQQTQQYNTYVDTGVTFLPLMGTAGVNGVIQCAGNDADEDEGVISTHSPAFMVSDTDADAKVLAFEARVKRASIADNACAMFIGLAFDHGSSVPVTNTLCLTDGDMDLGAFSYLGFHVDAADGDAIDFVVKAEGGAQTVIKAGVCVPVADTYNRLGFVYDPTEVAAKRIKIYVDGVEQTTYVTATQIAAATFPDAEPMALVWCVKTGSEAASTADMDWWRCWQSRIGQ